MSMVMDYGKLLVCAVRKQDIDLELEEIPFNIFLKNTGDVLSLCFLEFEDDDCLIVAETNGFGTEEMRVVPKDNIEYVGIFYDFTSLDGDDPRDNMFL